MLTPTVMNKKLESCCSSFSLSVSGKLQSCAGAASAEHETTQSASDHPAWCQLTTGNDHDIGWQNLNQLSHPSATLSPQARQARASGENLNYETLAPQVRQLRREILNYLLSH